MRAMREPPPFYLEAQAVVLREGLPESAFEAVRHDLTMKAYQAEAQPFIDLIVRAYNCATPTFLLRDAGVERLDDGLPESARELVTEARTAISALQVKYFGAEAWRLSLG